MSAHLTSSVDHGICLQLAGCGDWCASEDDVAEVVLRERGIEPGSPVRCDEELGFLRMFQVSSLCDALPYVARQHFVAAEGHVVGLSFHCHPFESGQLLCGEFEDSHCHRYVLHVFVALSVIDIGQLLPIQLRVALLAVAIAVFVVSSVGNAVAIAKASFVVRSITDTVALSIFDMVSVALAVSNMASIALPILDMASVALPILHMAAIALPILDIAAVALLVLNMASVALPVCSMRPINAMSISDRVSSTFHSAVAVAIALAIFVAVGNLTFNKCRRVLVLDVWKFRSRRRVGFQQSSVNERVNLERYPSRHLRPCVDAVNARHAVRNVVLHADS